MPLVRGTAGFSNAIDQTFVIDATTDFVAFRYAAFTTDPLVALEWFCVTKTGTGVKSFGVVITADNAGAPNVSAGVPVDIGAASPTLKELAVGDVTTNSRHTTTFTNSYTPTVNQVLWLVLYPVSGTWSGTESYSIRTRIARFGAEFGDEWQAQSTDTGATWVNQSTGIPTFSLQTTAAVYLTTQLSTCVGSSIWEDWNDASDPDERGTAWTIPANTTGSLWGVLQHVRTSTADADWELKAYLGDTQQGSTVTIDAAIQHTIAGNGFTGSYHFASAPVSIAAGTARVAVHPTHATATVRQFRMDFETQARRESCLLFKDYWYCHRNAGGAWTDDLAQAVSVLPLIAYAGTGGGGGGFIIGG